MRVLINGLGCPYTGSKYILEQVVSAVPADVRLTVIVPVTDRESRFDFPPDVRQIRLKHSIWGMYLRVFLELYNNGMMWMGRYDLLVNLSNYGLCFSRKQVLYIHNPYILDTTAATRFGQGRPNRLIRMALNTYLRTAESIFLQTDHMLAQLRHYCAVNAVPFPASVQVLKPPFPVIKKETVSAEAKTYAFQLFYPASPFPHKRTDVAIAATLLSRNSSSSVGLQVTVDSAVPVQGITFLGLISRNEVYRQFLLSDAMLFTSERETLGLPLLESMGFNKPAVLPNLPYAREIYGDAGIYFNDPSPDSISAAILQLMRSYPEYVEKVKSEKQHQMKSRLSWADHWLAFQDFFLRPAS